VCKTAEHSADCEASSRRVDIAGSQGGLDATMQRRRSLDPTPFEQLENIENPLRCPVKLYEFYLSKW